MSIWDMFKNKKEADVVDAALALLAEGDAVGAFACLRPAIAYPVALDDAAFARAFAAFARIAREIADDAPTAPVPFASLLEKASATGGDAHALYDAAYQAYERQLFDVAATLLMRANRLAPGTPMIVTEAAGALERMLRYGEAALLVESSGLAASDPFCAYLGGFCWLMCGDRERPRASLATLAGASDPRIVDVRERLTGMLARADALATVGMLEDAALTAWHMALNGTLLLHESPHGHPEPMHGRYAFVSDSQQLMHDGIERLHAVLKDHVPSRVVHAPDRASRILARAVAARFGLPLEAWTLESGSPADALVVAWTLDSVGDVAFLQALHEHAPGQVLFAHGSDWVEPFPFAPDVTTFLYQTVTNPWTGGALTAQQDGHVSPADPDDRADDVLAAEIADANGNDDSASSLDLVMRVRDAVRALRADHAAGLFRMSGKRALQRAGSVVPSARFA